MDANIFIQFISTVGFPIACSAALFWQMNKTNEQHRLEMDKMSEALNNNTIALTKLIEKIGG